LSGGGECHALERRLESGLGEDLRKSLHLGLGCVYVICFDLQLIRFTRPSL
jgi:hypothetical protein